MLVPSLKLMTTSFLSPVRLLYTASTLLASRKSTRRRSAGTLRSRRSTRMRGPYLVPWSVNAVALSDGSLVDRTHAGVPAPANAMRNCLGTLLAPDGLRGSCFTGGGLRGDCRTLDGGRGGLRVASEMGTVGCSGCLSAGGMVSCAAGGASFDVEAWPELRAESEAATGGARCAGTANANEDGFLAASPSVNGDEPRANASLGIAAQAACRGTLSVPDEGGGPLKVTLAGCPGAGRPRTAGCLALTWSLAAASWESCA
eukprot:scaffold2163_cov120-Isochrysis_galbana.AAC.4